MRYEQMNMDEIVKKDYTVIFFSSRYLLSEKSICPTGKE
jgi:hypothetical protein